MKHLAYRLSWLAMATSGLVACSKPAEPSSPTPAPSVSTTATPESSTLPPTADDAHAATGHDESGIAWKYANSGADVDAAFAEGKASGKPLFVYWGAKWCPPCNQVKATLFNRQSFIERSRAFVPVYVDGDSPGAQKIGARFNVSGYPTMVLFNPAGTEVTRLPGEVDAERYSQVLTLGMNADRPVRALLADALAGGQKLGPNDWKLLAFYAWDVDEQQIVPKADLPKTLATLAANCPASESEASARLMMKSLVASDAKKAPTADAASRQSVMKMLASAADTRAHGDMVMYYAPDLTRAMSAAGTPERAQVAQAFDTALKRLEADATLSRADRMQALAAQVDLARIDEPEAAPGAIKPAPRLPAALLADVREQTARADREVTNGYERQAVITAAADVLQEAGLSAESDALLKANLAKSHSPYYLMSELASNAKKRGDKAEALHWYGEAFARSEGPATRLQWGNSYVTALVDMAPTDDAEIEKTASTLFTEAAALPDAFYERSARSLQRTGTKLQAWNQGGAHQATMKRLQARLDAVCAPLSAGDGQRAACERILKAAPKPSA